MTGTGPSQDRAEDDLSKPGSPPTGSPVVSPPEAGRPAQEEPRVDAGADTDDPDDTADTSDHADSGAAAVARRAPRGRGRRAAGRAVLVVLLVALVLGGVGVAGERYARSRLDGVVRELVPGLSQDAVISTEGLVVPQVLAGSLDVLDVSAASLVLEQQDAGGGLGDVSSVELLDVEVSLRGVGLEAPHTVDSVEAVASLGFEELGAMVASASAEAPDLTIGAQTYGSGTEPGTLEAETSVLGMDATLTIEPSVTPEGGLLLTITGATLQGAPVDLDAELAGRTPLSLMGLDSSEITIGPEALPLGLSLTQAHVARDGLRLTMRGTEVDLSAL
ncbi:DUF2993 domain-containing protein [Actinomyces howellii]|uniref:DUF2993 domain-containing protein n=1 Tax=Actinomyces howellii TaxID=52771 RepID=A0A448HHE9_9ACTO|nr:DUF2993 domain-containing protein [Actinomyces howellii]VEG28284.1 Uncharacterised protein [Actinomyces howellii]